MIPTNYETNYFTLIGVFTRQSNCESIHLVSTNVSTFLTPIPDMICISPNLEKLLRVILIIMIAYDSCTVTIETLGLKEKVVC